MRMWEYDLTLTRQLSTDARYSGSFEWMNKWLYLIKCQTVFSFFFFLINWGHCLSDRVVTPDTGYKFRLFVLIDEGLARTVR